MREHRLGLREGPSADLIRREVVKKCIVWQHRSLLRKLLWEDDTEARDRVHLNGAVRREHSEESRTLQLVLM